MVSYVWLGMCMTMTWWWRLWIRLMFCCCQLILEWHHPCLCVYLSFFSEVYTHSNSNNVKFQKLIISVIACALRPCQAWPAYLNVRRPRILTLRLIRSLSQPVGAQVRGDARDRWWLELEWWERDRQCVAALLIIVPPCVEWAPTPTHQPADRQRATNAIIMLWQHVSLVRQRIKEK